ncbi:class I SAM-dependent methyltransferase [Alphaproteobacteria bacterium]|nr:class I SAM-dependent methyltransferase [Alphaproteobacteria bacterium]
MNNYYFYLISKIIIKEKFKRRHLLMQIKKNSIIGEIGVWKGEFSEKILKYCEPNKIILVDPWLYDFKIRGCAPQVSGTDPLSQIYFDQAYEEVLNKFSEKKNVQICKKNSLESSKIFNDNYFDYIYIDAEHSYNAVKNDLNYWYPKLKINGYIFGDDYYWREADNSFSVSKAYQDFFKEKNIKNWCVFNSQVIFKK